MSELGSREVESLRAAFRKVAEYAYDVALADGSRDEMLAGLEKAVANNSRRLGLEEGR